MGVWIMSLASFPRDWNLSLVMRLSENLDCIQGSCSERRSIRHLTIHE